MYTYFSRQHLSNDDVWHGSQSDRRHNDDKRQTNDGHQPQLGHVVAHLGQVHVRDHDGQSESDARRRNDEQHLAADAIDEHRRQVRAEDLQRPKHDGRDVRIEIRAGLLEDDDGVVDEHEGAAELVDRHQRRADDERAQRFSVDCKLKQNLNTHRDGLRVNLRKSEYVIGSAQHRSVAIAFKCSKSLVNLISSVEPGLQFE